MADRRTLAIGVAAGVEVAVPLSLALTDRHLSGASTALFVSTTAGTPAASALALQPLLARRRRITRQLGSLVLCLVLCTSGRCSWRSPSDEWFALLASASGDTLRDAAKLDHSRPGTACRFVAGRCCGDKERYRYEDQTRVARSLRHHRQLRPANAVVDAVGPCGSGRIGLVTGAPPCPRARMRSGCGGVRA